MGNQGISACCATEHVRQHVFPRARWVEEEECGHDQIVQAMDSDASVDGSRVFFAKQGCVAPPRKDTTATDLPPSPMASSVADNGTSSIYSDIERPTQPRLTPASLDIVNACLTPRNEPFRRFVSGKQSDEPSLNDNSTSAATHLHLPDTASDGKHDLFDSISWSGRSSDRLVLSSMGIVPSGALHVVIDRIGDIREVYRFESHKLGEGSFGTVKRATVKATRAVRAVKTISKGFLKTKKGIVEALKREIAITKTVDHPNIVRLFDVWEDGGSIRLVLELCSGGSLLSRLKNQKLFSEAQSALALFQILRGLNYLHCQNICHRDMKLDNCLCTAKDPFDKADLARIKISDFGLSCKFKPRVWMTMRAGTRTHMAPEVFQKRYTQTCDVWSVGVMAYEMLCGYLPFKGKDDKELSANVQAGIYSFGSSEWLDASQQALAFVSACLRKNPVARQTAQQALAHDFMEARLPKVAESPLESHIIQNLRDYGKMNRLQRAVLCIVASLVPESAIKESRDVFCRLDWYGDGHISITDPGDRPRAGGTVCPGSPPKSGRSKTTARRRASNPAAPPADAVPHMYKHHANDDNTAPQFITYTEFLAATIDRSFVLQPDVCRAVFRCFDHNGDGHISLSEFAAGRLMGPLSLEELGQIFSQLDANGDREVDEAEFSALMAQFI